VFPVQRLSSFNSLSSNGRHQLVSHRPQRLVSLYLQMKT